MFSRMTWAAAMAGLMPSTVMAVAVLTYESYDDLTPDEPGIVLGAPGMGFDSATIASSSAWVFWSWEHPPQPDTVSADRQIRNMSGRPSTSSNDGRVCNRLGGVSGRSPLSIRILD